MLNVPTLLAPSPPGVSSLRRVGRLVGAAASPLFLLCLFYAQATDVIAQTAAMAERRYGKDPRFRQWVDSTPLVLPTLASVSRFLGA